MEEYLCASAAQVTPQEVEYRRPKKANSHTRSVVAAPAPITMHYRDKKEASAGSSEDPYRRQGAVPPLSPPPGLHTTSSTADSGDGDVQMVSDTWTNTTTIGSSWRNPLSDVNQAVQNPQEIHEVTLMKLTNSDMH